MNRNSPLSRRAPLRSGSGLKRGGALARVTPLQPGGPLGRKVPLARNPEPKGTRAPKGRSPQGSVRAALRFVLACEMTVAEASRVHGCDRDALEAAARKACRAAVMERDHWTCQACGRMADDVQHRIRRGMGGTSDTKIAFGMVNQVALCREDHDKCDRERNRALHARGFWLEPDEDPAAVPVVVETEFGPYKRWLLADGTWSADRPEGATAA